MNKHEFIKKLRYALDDKIFTKEMIEEISEDYSMMIDEAIDRGEDEEHFIAKIGDPRVIAKALRKELPSMPNSSNKWIAISPFIALIVFFFVGFTYNAWHPTWLVFLIIPVTAIALETKGMERVVSLSVFFALSGFMLLGTYYDLWHPMWALFVFIPGFGFLTQKSKVVQGFGIYTLFATTAFIFIVLLINPSGYYHYLLILPVIAMGIMAGDIEVAFGYSKKNKLRDFFIGALFTISLLTIYIYIGLTFSLWHPGWLIFLLIPVLAMLHARFIRSESIPLVGFMPFISVFIFILWGEYGNAYSISWLAFLLIPMVAILSEPPTKRKR
jgi:uncharacterized membrane protein